MDRFRTILFGSLVAGSLMISAGAAVAQVSWRDVDNDRERLRMGYDELDRNRDQLNWDLDHGASSYQVDRDQRAIQDNLRDIRRDRDILRRDLRDLREDLR